MSIPCWMRWGANWTEPSIGSPTVGSAPSISAAGPRRSAIPARLQGLADRAATLLDCSGVEEFTVEANPDDMTEEWLEALARTGANRLSVGVQSFDDDELRLMNRRHTGAQAVEAVRRAQAAGFANLTIDLIFGVPGFGGKVLQRNLEQALALGVQHISAYH